MGAKIIMVVTPAAGHQDIAQRLSPYLEEGQIIVLNPGRTGGALEVRQVSEKQDVRDGFSLRRHRRFFLPAAFA